MMSSMNMKCNFEMTRRIKFDKSSRFLKIVEIYF